MHEETKILFTIFFGGWLLIGAIRSFRRGWVWKYYHLSRTIGGKVYKDENPFYFWNQVMLSGGVGVILISFGLNLFSQYWLIMSKKKDNRWHIPLLLTLFAVFVLETVADMQGMVVRPLFLLLWAVLFYMRLNKQI